MEEAQKWAASLSGAAYAMDDASAISVVDGVVTVVSEGEWQKLA
jgi:dipeptidase E